MLVAGGDGEGKGQAGRDWGGVGVVNMRLVGLNVPDRGLYEEVGSGNVITARVRRVAERLITTGSALL